MRGGEEEEMAVEEEEESKKEKPKMISSLWLWNSVLMGFDTSPAGQREKGLGVSR